MIRKFLRQAARKFWMVLTWQGLKTPDRLKLWGLEICALFLLGTLENPWALLALIATAAMYRWVRKTVNRDDLEELLKKIDDENYGK